jgi:transcriptional regulator GlxA family with amidase domain
LTHWRPAGLPGEMACSYDTKPGVPPQIRFLIIPPTLSGFPDPELMGCIAAWVRQLHSRGVTLASVCTGLYVLAETGLLAGRSVATHPRCARDLSQRFPSITIDPERRVLDDGDVITAGGYMAWVDIALLLIDRMLGGLARAETMRFLRGDPDSQNTRYKGPGLDTPQGRTRRVADVLGSSRTAGSTNLSPALYGRYRPDAGKVLPGSTDRQGTRAS